MTTPAPFGFGSDAPAPVLDEAAPAPAAAAPAVPVGSLVSWTEHDQYDELHPERVRYGVVVALDQHGAAQVLALGESRRLAHFAPPSAAVAAGGVPVVSDLTVVR